MIILFNIQIAATAKIFNGETYFIKIQTFSAATLGHLQRQ